MILSSFFNQIVSYASSLPYTCDLVTLSFELQVASRLASFLFFISTNKIAEGKVHKKHRKSAKLP